MHQIILNLRIFLPFFFSALVPVVALPATQALGLEMPQTLIEQVGAPLLFPGQSVSVQALVSDPLDILAVRCYFRYRQDADFVFVDMEQKERGLYQGFLPAPAESAQTMEYLYLAVNGRRQVVRTAVHSVHPLGKIRVPAPATHGQANFQVQTDLAVIPDPGSQLFSSGQVGVAPVAFAKRFGLTAGLYGTDTDDAGINLVQGFFGAYELRPDGKYMPVKGRISLPGKTRSTAEVAGGTAATESLVDPEIIGPDIAGDTWEGLCYYGWGESTGNWYIWDPTPITATVTHVGNAVTITLSTECTINLENIGQFFEGTVDWGGNMLLVDQRDPVQAWSSHWGPVTESEIKIGDYVVPPTEEEPFPDYYVIEVTREYPPPPPPPPPPNLTFLPAIYHLLLAK